MSARPQPAGLGACCFVASEHILCSPWEHLRKTDCFQGKTMRTVQEWSKQAACYLRFSCSYTCSWKDQKLTRYVLQLERNYTWLTEASALQTPHRSIFSIPLRSLSTRRIYLCLEGRTIPGFSLGEVVHQVRASTLV